MDNLLQEYYFKRVPQTQLILRVVLGHALRFRRFLRTWHW